MDYTVVPKITINSERCIKYGAFLYDPQMDALFHSSPWPFPVQIGIYNNLKYCEVTPGFLRLPFILKGWINLDILLREIELLNYVRENKILMHGSCVDQTLIVGFPNSGKTYQTYKSVAEGGILVSEEYTLIDHNGIASPYKPVMRTCFSKRTIDDCGIKINTLEKFQLLLNTIRATLMPFMFESVIWKEIPASGTTAKIKKIVYGSTGKEIKDWKTFAILCENEFPFMSSEFLQAYAVATGLDLLSLQARQRDLIRVFVESVYNPSKS